MKRLTADGIASALVNDCERLAAGIGERAMTMRRGDALLYIFGVPEATMNGVVTVRASVAAADVGSLLDIVRERGWPHSVQIRPGCDPDVLKQVKARGLVEGDPLPVMAMGRDTGLLGKSADHPELSIRVLGASEAGVHYAVAAEGYEAPIEIFEALIPPSAWAISGLRVYVGTVDGEPVTTSVGLTDGDYVGIYDVATPARFRGRGYGAAITARAALDGFENGASIAYLQSSPMGLKVYERLGFRTLETWSVWLSDRPSHS